MSTRVTKVITLWGIFYAARGSWNEALRDDSLVLAVPDFGLIAGEIRNAQGGPPSAGAQSGGDNRGYSNASAIITKHASDPSQRIVLI